MRAVNGVLHINVAECSVLPVCAHGTQVQTHLGPIEVDTVRSFKYLGSLLPSTLEGHEQINLGLECVRPSSNNLE